MNADSAFQIGASHAVCQDYSLAGAGLPAMHSETPGWQAGPYVILSDGCSSSPDTDIGARLLVKAAEHILRGPGRAQASDLAEIHKEAARLALAWAGLMGLPPQAVDATLLTAHLDGEELVIGCSGDGTICLQAWSGAVDAYSISYPSGYPLYPSYAHQPRRLLAMEDEGRLRKEIKHLRSASVEDRLRMRGAHCGDSLTEVLTASAPDYKNVSLFSDGIHSFFHARQTEDGFRSEAVPFGEVLRQLISFKSTRGAFVGRRMKRFLKDCRAKGLQHTDDLSVGALHLGG